MSRQHIFNHFSQINHSQNLISVKHESIKKIGIPEPVKIPYFYDHKKHSFYHKGMNIQNKRSKTPTKYFLKGNLRRPATVPQKNEKMKEYNQNIKKRLTSSIIESMKYDKCRMLSPMLKPVRLSYDNSNKQKEFL